MTNAQHGIHIFFDASLIGAAKLMGSNDARILYPGHSAWPHDQDEADEVWLPYVGGDHWLTILRDRKIRFRRAEKSALVDNRVRAINLAMITNLTVQETAQLLETNWVAIEETLNSPPAFYHLTTAGLKTMLNYD